MSEVIQMAFSQVIGAPIHAGDFSMIRLPDGYFAIIDPGDYPLISAYEWQVHGTDKWRYAVSGSIRMHRLVIGAPAGMHVDHINGNTLDNRKANLRVCTNTQNRWNQDARRNTKSGFKGVTYCKHKQKWQAEITFQGRRLKLGRHATAEAAARAYDRIAWLCFGEFARLNFPTERKPRESRNEN